MSLPLPTDPISGGHLLGCEQCFGELDVLGQTVLQHFREAFLWANVLGLDSDNRHFGLDANTPPERQNFHAKGRGNGYLLTLGGTRIYISGDTEDVPEMRALENIDAAFVCMNLPYTMEVTAAAGAVLEFRPKVVFPYHYRGKSGMSDLDQFQSLVAKDPGIEIRLLEWY